MAEAQVTLRHDEGTNNFVLAAQLPGTSIVFEATGFSLSDVFSDIAQQFEDEGV